MSICLSHSLFGSSTLLGLMFNGQFPLVPVNRGQIRPLISLFSTEALEHYQTHVRQLAPTKRHDRSCQKPDRHDQDITDDDVHNPTLAATVAAVGPG